MMKSDGNEFDPSFFGRNKNLGFLVLYFPPKMWEISPTSKRPVPFPGKRFMRQIFIVSTWDLFRKPLKSCKSQPLNLVCASTQFPVCVIIDENRKLGNSRCPNLETNWSQTSVQFLLTIDILLSAYSINT